MNNVAFIFNTITFRLNCQMEHKSALLCMLGKKFFNLNIFIVEFEWWVIVLWMRWFLVYFFSKYKDDF